MYKLRNSPLNNLKINNRQIINIIEFRFLKYKFLYAALFIFYVCNLVFVKTASNGSIGIWGLIGILIGALFLAIFVYVPIYFLLEIPNIKIFSLKITSLVYNFLGKSTLSRLLIEIAKYNKNVKDLIITCASNNINQQDPAVLEVASSLAKSKEYIIKALEAETILRNNPDYNPSRFYDLTHFSESFNINNKTKQYERIFNENARIAFSIEREMASILNR